MCSQGDMPTPYAICTVESDIERRKGSWSHHPNTVLTHRALCGEKLTLQVALFTENYLRALPIYTWDFVPAEKFSSFPKALSLIRASSIT